MPPTSYTIGFTIHEARNLATKGGVPVDPLVVVKCCGREYTTQIKRGKAGVVSWDEAQIWSDIDLRKKVQAANAFWRNDVIGSCTLQLSVIHARKCHQMKRSLPLQLLNEPDPQGYLRVTTYVIGPDDTPPSPNDADSEDEAADATDDIRRAVLDTSAPEQGEAGKPYHLYVSVHRVEHLPKAPKGERDPFVTCEFGSCRLKSTQARSTCNHSYNECFRMPIITPVQEDTILLCLWDWNLMAPDELLAHGQLSFTELRAKPIAMKWFNFYGFDKSEIPSLSVFKHDAEEVPPANFYMGRMQISARAERVDKMENLMPAQIVAARAIEGAYTYPLCLLADVYEANGLPGDQLAVEIWCGAISGRTRWVTGEVVEPAVDSGVVDSLLGSVGLSTQTSGLKRFTFDQKGGRIEPLVLNVPEDERQQWDVIISVYARGGSLRNECRVAYHRLQLKELPPFIDINPRTPAWIPLRMMPHISGVNYPGAILMTLEKSKTETVARGKRKFIASQEYELRTYIHAARDLPRLGSSPPNPAVRITCAGVTAQTTPQFETSCPVFTECIRLKCRLATDPSVNLSTVAPIAITIIDVRNDKQYFLARATCTYDRVRGKIRAGETTEPLEPRWIKLKGGGEQLHLHTGDILVAFELVRKKDAPKIPAQSIRPRLKSCALDIALYGLRDLIMSKTAAGFLQWLVRSEPEQMRLIKRPLVLVSVAAWGQDGENKTQMLVPWNPTLPNDPLSKNKHWKAGVQASYDCFSSVRLDCLLPEDPVYDPRLTISVYDRRIKPKYFIGDLDEELLSNLPWIKDVSAALGAIDARDDFVETINLRKLGLVLQGIQSQLKDQKKGFLNLGISVLKEADAEAVREGCCEGVKPTSSVKSQWIAQSGVPTVLLQAYEAIKILNLPVTPIVLNMMTLNVFIPSKFVIAAHGTLAEKQKKSENFRPSVDGLLEDYLSDLAWDSKHLQRKVGKVLVCPGVVKMAAAITYNETVKTNLPEDVASNAFDEKKFRKKYRSENYLPTAIRIRVYVTRAIGLTPTQQLRSVNPFLIFTFGSKVEGLRGNAKENNANPEFCWLQESDINLPEQTRLDISVWSKQSGMGRGDVLIGSTVIDLEERWFSREWQRLVTSQKVPMEYRPLRPPSNAEKSCGTLEIWVEMYTPQRALEIPRAVLKEAPPAEIEIRVIIWGARSLSFRGLRKDSIDAQITCSIDCAGYHGTQDIQQSTDVHYFSRNGNAVFNWRVIYSRIILPVSSCVLQISAYDFRTIGSAVFVGEVNVDLRSYLEKVALTQASREYDAEFRLVNRKHAKADQIPGYVQVTIQLMAQQEALTKSAGLGRESPNKDPRLTTPLDGRKWEDFLRASGLRRDFSPLMLKIRVGLVFFLFFGLFIMGVVYPGLFFQ